MIDEAEQNNLLAQVPTPRTDAWLQFTFATSDIMRAAPMACQNLADLARGLERENVMLRKALKHLEEIASMILKESGAEGSALKQARAALAHKKL